MQQSRLRISSLESSFVEKGLVVLVGKWLNIRHKIAPVERNGTCFVGYISVAARSSAVVLLCLIVMGLQLQCCVQFWASLHRKDIDILV